MDLSSFSKSVNCHTGFGSELKIDCDLECTDERIFGRVSMASGPWKRADEYVTAPKESPVELINHMFSLLDCGNFDAVQTLLHSFEPLSENYEITSDWDRARRVLEGVVASTSPLTHGNDSRAIALHEVRNIICNFPNWVASEGQVIFAFRAMFLIHGRTGKEWHSGAELGYWEQHGYYSVLPHISVSLVDREEVCPSSHLS